MDIDKETRTSQQETVPPKGNGVNLLALEALQFLWCGACLATGLMVFSFFGGEWIPDLASQFFVEYFVYLLVVCLLCLGAKRWHRALYLAPFILWSGYETLRFYVPMTPPLGTPVGHFSILQINVNRANREFDRVATCVKNYNADFLSIEEADAAWVSMLSEKLPMYKLVMAEPSDDNFGIALFSKIPVAEHQMLHLGKANTPAVIAKFAFGADGTAVTLVNLHVLPPVTSDYFRYRNEQFAFLASEATLLQEQRLVLVGDFNSGPWSQHFKRLCDNLNLVDTRQGFGLQPTWPVGLPWLYIPIDHVLVSPKLHPTKREVGPDVGSDHFPVYVELDVFE